VDRYRQASLPLLFGPWMDYRDTEKFGDFKYFWELPRLQQLICLAKAYFLTGNEVYAQEVERQLLSFTEQSPYLLGVNWIMPMEAAIRLVSLSWITAFLKSYLAHRPQTCAAIESLLRSHIDYTVANYAAYSSANNHLIGEAAGVFIATTCFWHLKGAQRRRNKAWEILHTEILRQHHPDGVNKEQAVHYQMFAFDFLLMAALLAKANGIAVPKAYWKTLENSATFIGELADHKCRIPQIGDSDDGMAVLLSSPEHNHVHALLSTAAVLFNRPDWKQKVGQLDETTFWLLGKTAAEKFAALDGQDNRRCAAFEHGGYYILRSNGPADMQVIFDCGPLGLSPLCAHGHADCLSIVLEAYGEPFLIDPGTYTYIAKDPFRNYFRSTAAHNTLSVDDLDQSEMAGPFLWSSQARAQLQQWTDTEGYARLSAWHDGYQRLADPVTHHRSIELDKRSETLTITDTVEAEQVHTLALNYHFAPQCQVQQDGPNRWIIRCQAGAIAVATDPKLSCHLFKASTNPIAGWASDRYDQIVPTYTLTCRGQFTQSQSFTTSIQPHC